MGFATALCVNNATAQINPEIGIRTGVNFATFSDSKQEVDSRRIGLLIGIYANLPLPIRILGNPVSIQPEILYTQKGAEINEVEVRLSYIEVPVLVRLDFSTPGLLSQHIYLGPYVAFNLNYEEEPAGSLANTNNIVFGAVVGLGVDINRINVGIRYSWGVDVFEFEEANNSVISIAAGISF